MQHEHYFQATIWNMVQLYYIIWKRNGGYPQAMVQSIQMHGNILNDQLALVSKVHPSTGHEGPGGSRGIALLFL